MAKKKRELELGEPIAEFSEVEEVAPSEPEPVVVVPTKKSAVRSRVKPAKRMNFNRYARSKGIKATHIPGMKARAGNPNIPRTLEEWDTYFLDY